MDLKKIEGIFHFVDACDVERQKYVWELRNRRTMALNQPKSRASLKAKKENTAIVVCDGPVVEKPVRKKRITKKEQLRLAIEQLLN